MNIENLNRSLFSPLVGRSAVVLFAAMANCGVALAQTSAAEQPALEIDKVLSDIQGGTAEPHLERTQVTRDGKTLSITTISTATPIPAPIESQPTVASTRRISLERIGFENVGFDVPVFELPEFNLPTLNVPDFSFPDIKAPDFNVPDFKMPELNIPTFDSLSFDNIGQLAVAGVGAVRANMEAVWNQAVSLWRQYPTQIALALSGALLLFGSTWLSGKRKRVARRMTQRMLDALPDAVAIFNTKGQLTAINRKLRGFLPMEMAQNTFPHITSSDLYAQLSPDNLAIERARNQAREAKEDPDATISFEVPSFGRRSLLVKERATEDGGTAISVYGAYKPVTTRLSDPLTALPNRARLLNELAQRCSKAKDELALIIVDLRSFRQINDTYGRATGDELLKQTGICLQHCMPQDALIARTAGDEFAVLLEFDRSRAQIEQRVSRFLATLRHGLNVNTINVPIRASIGIAFAPEHGNTVSSLLKCADSACANAKQLGNNTMVVYNSEQQLESKRRHQLEVGLQQAIPKGELSLQYQPQVDIASNMTCGMEALLRWNSPEFGRVSPIEFIDIAEKSGIIKPIGTWVLQQAIADYQRLARFGMSPPTLSVNLSRKQFEGGKIVRDVAKVLHRTGFDPACLCLEITETAIYGDSDAMKNMLHDLTKIGVKLAIDDFGVGYSSLLELRDFPISEIKIDRAFVMDVVTNSSSQDIIHAIVDIASSIGADVVAEGIEDQQQLDMVAALGCHRVQGYYLCEPMAATTFPDLVLSA